jgi:hypothetical protein
MYAIYVTSQYADTNLYSRELARRETTSPPFLPRMAPRGTTVH